MISMEKLPLQPLKYQNHPTKVAKLRPLLSPFKVQNSPQPNDKTKAIYVKILRPLMYQI